MSAEHDQRASPEDSILLPRLSRSPIVKGLAHAMRTGEAIEAGAALLRTGRNSLGLDEPEQWNAGPVWEGLSPATSTH